MLEIKDLFVSYGMMEVLHGISLKVEDRELVSVIGPNGAGKSTLIKTVMGLVKPTSGQILYNGQPVEWSEREDEDGAKYGVVSIENVTAADWITIGMPSSASCVVR